MKPLKTVLFASVFLAGGMLAAGAQTTSPSANISAATHCKDAQGNVQLKTAANAGTPGTPVTSGNTKGNGADTSMKAGTTGSGTMSGSAGSASGSMSGSTAAAANLAPCK